MKLIKANDIVINFDNVGYFSIYEDEDTKRYKICFDMNNDTSITITIMNFKSTELASSYLATAIVNKNIIDLADYFTIVDDEDDDPTVSVSCINDKK